MIDDLLSDLNAIPGTRTYGFDQAKMSFRIGLACPDGSEVPLVVEPAKGRWAYFDVAEAPPVTPPAYLTVMEVLAKYEFMVWASREEPDEG